MATKNNRFWIKIIGVEREIQIESIMTLDVILERLLLQEFVAFGDIILQSKQVQYIQNR
jgi:hypothetical protein